MFRSEKSHSKEFYTKAVEEWCKKHAKKNIELISKPTGNLSEEDLELVVQVFTAPHSICILQDCFKYLSYLKHLKKEGKTGISLLSCPVGKINPTFGYWEN